jgi:glycosyltransferase involved in cell wall biosynthesis
MSRKSLLSISVIIYARNEESNLKRLFSSLKKQNYPKNKIEYIYIDDKSTDRSVSIAKEFGAKIFRVNTGDIELNKGIGMHKAKNDLVYWMDADMEVIDKDFFLKLSYPLQKDPKMFASFTNEFALDKKHPVKNSFLRFISYDPLQRDPLYQVFSPSIQETIIRKGDGYFVCKFVPKRIPPAGRSMYRRLKLLKTDVSKNESFIDLETLEIVSRAGHQHFAYVPGAKIRHFHAENINVLIKKRLRNLSRDYLPNLGNKYYTWFDLKNPKDVIKIISWIIWVNLLIPESIVGLYKSIKFKDLAFLWQPIVSVVTTDLIIFSILTSKGGWKLISSIFGSSNH